MNDETETGCVRLSTEANKRIVRITKRGNAVGLQRMNKVVAHCVIKFYCVLRNMI